MSNIEDRLFSDRHTRIDAEWVHFLNDIFMDVSLASFIEKGLAPNDARKLISILALSPRLNASADTAAA